MVVIKKNCGLTIEKGGDLTIEKGDVTIEKGSIIAKKSLLQLKRLNVGDVNMKNGVATGVVVREGDIEVSNGNLYVHNAQSFETINGKGNILIGDWTKTAQRSFGMSVR